MPDVLVNIKGMGLIAVPDTLIGGNERGAALYRNIDGMDRANPDSPFAGLRSRAAKQNAFDDKVQGVLSGIGNQIADVAINDEGGLNNPAQLKAALDDKYKEVRAFGDAITQGLTPLQKAAFLTMGFDKIGDITGLAADAEMYFTDPESRTWANAALSGVGAVGSVATISPSVAAILPMVKRNAEALSDTAQAARRSDMGVGKSGRRVGTTGQYIGAPEGMNTPEALDAMRQDYMDQVVSGIDGRDWYFDSSKWIDEVSPDAMEQWTADSLAITSQGTGVDANLGFAVKGINQTAAGEAVNTGRFPDRASVQIDQARAGDRTGVGPKREPFADNLSMGWNPEMAKHPVHDIWQGRAFGYKHAPTKKYPEGKPWDAGFSAQQHAFMDEEMQYVVDNLNANKVGGHSDWDMANTQAAAWSGAKIRAGDIKPSEAASHYGTFAPKYEARATYEQAPGVGTGHLPGLAEENFDLRLNYENDPNASWKNNSGQDRLYSSAGMLNSPTNEMVGAYTPAGGTLEINPGKVAYPLTQTKGTITDSSGGLLLKADENLLNTIESSRAFIDTQNAGAWHRIIPASQVNAGEMSSAVVNLGRNPTPEEMAQFSAFADAKGMFAVDSGNGQIAMINDSYSDIGGSRTGTLMGKDLKGEFGKELAAIAPDVTSIERAKIQSGYIDYQADLQNEVLPGFAGSGRATQRFLDQLENNPTIMKNIEPELRAKAGENFARDAARAAETGDPVREDVQRARQILRDEGLSGLKAALMRKELLPAVAAALVVPFLSESDDSPPEMI